MATATSTVTLNAAFLQEIKDDNQELWRLLGEARQAFALQAAAGDAQPGDGSSGHRIAHRKLSPLLEQLRDILALHFALEEAFGYFDDPLSVVPRLGARAEALRAQHAELFLDMLHVVDLCERLVHHEAPLSKLAGLASAFRRFDEKLRKHETAENELVVQALDEDIGVGD